MSSLKPRTVLPNNASNPEIRLKQEQDALAAVALRARRLSQVRLLVFSLMIAAVVYATFATQQLVWAVPLALLLIFAVFVKIHNQAKRQLQMLQATVSLFEMRNALQHGQWSRLPQVDVTSKTLPHWAVELDVVGEVSLLRMLGGATTALGHRSIEDWLFAPANVDEILARQNAVRELIGDSPFIEKLQVSSLLTPSWSARNLAPFLEWSERSERALSPALLMWCRFVTVSVVVTSLLYGANVVPDRVPVIAIIASIITAAVIGWRATRSLVTAEGKEGPIQSFSASLLLIEQQSTLRSEKVAALRNSLTSEGVKASEALQKLARYLELAQIRYSPMMYALLMALFLWDVHLTAALEKWRDRHGRHTRRWLNALGEMEALCAIASVAELNRDWCFPTITTSHATADAALAGDTFKATGLAHPLLPRDTRVANDVVVGPPGTFLLVTGSNMSGKSTLLRAIGVNCVLAQAGAPVCAQSLAMPPIVLATSVQIQDSLAQGVSRFMAELLRLREVVETVSRGGGEASAGSAGSAMPLYLLDEILQGTNTAERQVGARMVLLRLVQSRCIGVVTTHDLALADSAELRPAAHMVHFSEGVEEVDGRVVLSFEYKLREGLATATNALKLMRAVGLESHPGI